MLKTFEELRKLDISKYVKDRDGFDYLNWAKCIDLLHENGAEKVYFTPLTNENGSSLFMSEMEFRKDANTSPNRCYEVAIEIVIDDDKFIMRGPVMNGANPVRDNSMSQQRVWNAQTRAFVKGVAIHTGLGFDLWCKSEQVEEDNSPKEDDIYKHSLKVIKERMEQEVTTLMQKGLSLSDVAKSFGWDEEVFRSKFSYFAELYNMEKKLLELINDSK